MAGVTILTTPPWAAIVEAAGPSMAANPLARPPASATTNFNASATVSTEWTKPELEVPAANGLGLAIASAIVHAHGGTVTPTHNVPQGLTNTVTLPPEHATPVGSEALEAHT